MAPSLASSRAKEAQPATRLPGAVPRQRTPVKPAEVLVCYSLLMMIVGALAFASAGYNPRAVSAFYAGNGVALVSLVCALGVRRHGKVEKGEPGFVGYMIGIHFALVVPVVFAAMSTWRFALAWSVPAKHYLLPFLAANIILSLACFGFLHSFKPKKLAKIAKEPRDQSIGNATAKSN
jgi:hypothetical protein